MQPGSGRRDDAPPWRVELHPAVAKTVARYGLTTTQFRPTLGRLIASLKSDPYAYRKKAGKLRDAYAAPLRFGNATWRAVYTIDKAGRVVRLLALGPHDGAYIDAERRI